MIETAYNRENAVAYAKKWAFGRNPAYYNFNLIGGDCTNFASQCIYAGAEVMNFTPVTGWYYRSVNDRSPSWTGVEYLYNFLTANEGVGPFAKEAPLSELEPGDIVQLGTSTGDYYHSPVVVAIRNGMIFVAAHTNDAFNRPLSSYNFAKARGIHILGVRKEE
ncbi:MAG: amidase domain-containing protein [Clostridiales bacterium]|nr:amidase domain-containing protein [Clostridiales bacterium]